MVRPGKEFAAECEFVGVGSSGDLALGIAVLGRVD